MPDAPKIRRKVKPPKAKARDLCLLDRKALGDKFTSTRLALRLSLNEVTAASGVATSHISYLERGQKGVSLEKFLALCSALQLDPGQVLRESAPTIAQAA